MIAGTAIPTSGKDATFRLTPMNVDGEYRIPAPRERIWEALHDPETLRACIPGCEDIHKLAEGEYAGRLMAQVGAVTTVFAGTLRLADEDFPRGWTLSAHMESSSAGWADGWASVALTAEAQGTVLVYRARFGTGGRLASVGNRLLHGVAIRMANDFFARLIERMKPHPIATEPQEMAEPAPKAPRRIVNPLAPTSAPMTEAPAAIAHASSPPAENAGLPGVDSHSPLVTRIIITAGYIFYVGLLTVMLWPRK